MIDTSTFWSWNTGDEMLLALTITFGEWTDRRSFHQRDVSSMKCVSFVMFYSFHNEHFWTERNRAGCYCSI